MRSETEIQRAHDMLVSILLGEVPNPFAGSREVDIAAQVLCWILQHDHNDGFAINLEHIEHFFKERGIVIADMGVLNKRRPPQWNNN